MAQLTYRDAVARGIAQEMERDERVVLIGEDIAGAGGVFKTTVGLLERFGPRRVIDTPISEQAILGAAMGAAMTGLRPVAEIMFSDFFAVCWDLVANQMAKTRYMTNGQVTLPLVVKSGNGGGLRFGAQHSQSIENWAMAVPGLKVVTPSTPEDVIGLMAAAIRSDDPVLFFEHKGLYASKGEVPDGVIEDELGTARIRRTGKDATVLALGLMVPRTLAAADALAARDIECEVIDVRSLVPLDTRTILESVGRTGRLFTVEENPRLLGWGAEIASIVSDEAFWDLDGPVVRITTPHLPLPSADSPRGPRHPVCRAHPGRDRAGDEGVSDMRTRPGTWTARAYVVLPASNRWIWRRCGAAVCTDARPPPTSPRPSRRLLRRTRPRRRSRPPRRPVAGSRAFLRAGGSSPTACSSHCACRLS